MRKVLFLNDRNGYLGDPIADLVEVPESIGTSILRALENATREGGWERIMIEGSIVHNVISTGNKSDYTEKDYDEVYKLRSSSY